MPDLNKHITIPKNTATGDDLDFAFLRQKGQEYIEKLGSNLWTDYNTHDPGITILEMLCYAITDLGARIDMPVANILSPADETGDPVKDQFFEASEIFPSSPVSELDYRKLFIDIDGVKNCWLLPYEKTVYVDCNNDRLSYDADDFSDIEQDFKRNFHLQGLYAIKVDFEELDADDFPTEEAKQEEYDRITEEIATLYHANRNLCEDLVEVKEVETQPVAVCAEIEVYPDVDEEQVHARVLRAIDNYFSPSIRFYSLKQMFDKGYTSDKIFEGPVLTKGFIDPEELKAASLREEVRLSDLIHMIKDIEGVKHIRDITIFDCSNPGEDEEPWVICIDEGKKPIRCDDSAFSYFKGVMPVNVNAASVKQYMDEMEQDEKEEQEQAKYDMEIEIPEGTYSNTGDTTTIQNDFPDTYGVGRFGLPSRMETSRKAKAKQLKGYLLFFDQILASYFAHLEKVKDLLAVDNKLKKTYFTQAVRNIKDFDELVIDYPQNDDELTTELFEGLDDNIKRKNELLDHLIARFSEQFNEYAFLMKALYGTYADKAVLQSKQSFLKDYDITSRQRGLAFNYYQQPEEKLWNTGNVSGVQKRIARMSGIKDYTRRDLSESLVEIYDLVNADGDKVYRWRIKNTGGTIILSATEEYLSQRQAQDELYLAVVRIIETDPDHVRKAFEGEIEDEAVIGNFEVQIAASGKYSFNVLNKKAPPSGTDYVIARQYIYYETQEAFRQAILDIIDFMTTDFTEEGMFVVEHILLRPDVTQDTAPLDRFMPICTDKCTSCQPLDPYSYRITVVLPGWTYRFSNADFRKFLENLIRKEIPAHVLARICWIGYRKDEVPHAENEMVRFENAYKAFLFDKTGSGQAQDPDKLKNLIEILNELNSIYPTGSLLDCDEEDETLEGKIILGRTNIGNL